MEANSEQLTPKLIEIRDFYISNPTTRSGTIYANGVMQAIIYIHYGYRGETTNNSEVEQYINDNIAFYYKGENPDSGNSAETSLPFTVVTYSDDYIHDLEVDTGSVYDTDQANSDDQTTLITKVYVTVKKSENGDYPNFQPYVEGANNSGFNSETVLRLNAIAFNISTGNITLLQEETQNHDNGGYSDLWSVSYDNMTYSKLKLQSLIDFERNKSTARNSTDKTSSGTYLNGIPDMNCMLLFSGDDDHKMVLGYTPEYYKIEGSPEPYFGNSRDVPVYAYSTVLNEIYVSLDTGESTSGYPADYTGDVKDRFSDGKVFMFGIKGNHGPIVFNQPDHVEAKYFTLFNHTDDKCFFMFRDNAGNIAEIKFDFKNDWKGNRSSYISIMDVAP